jgi:hypothetical protein
MRMLGLQNGKLLPKSQVFHEQVATRAKESGNKTEEKLQQAEHPTSLHRQRQL